MKLVRTLKELREARASLAEPVGLVPTMGYLHEGHLSLVQAAHRSCASVVVSIFVNPTQFGPQEDLARYPRDLQHDLDLLEKENVDIVWAPEDGEMYPPDYQTWVSVENVTRPLEGELRPGHFRGVTTVVSKLFNTVQPQKAFFGQKDAQQAQVILRMVADLNFPIDIQICPIIREADGLAMSSRNTYLSPAERQAAPILNRALLSARSLYENGERNAAVIKNSLQDIFKEEPLARPQYIAVVDPATFEEIGIIQDKALILLAVYFGKTRLIDNLILSGK
ncbi:MAG: pantoate--beta-alanine ligase [Anaerolineae bacterium]|nr:pantoate--beta-alanine ligase [Anaerolineae bacterium]